MTAENEQWEKHFGMEIIHQAIEKRSEKQKARCHNQSGVFPRQFLFGQKIQGNGGKADCENLQIQQEKGPFQDQIKGNQEEEDRGEMDCQVAAPAITMERFCHDRAFQGSGNCIIEKGEIEGIGGEGKMLERTQQEEQQQPGQQEIAEKTILSVKEQSAVQKIFNWFSPILETRI